MAVVNSSNCYEITFKVLVRKDAQQVPPAYEMNFHPHVHFAASMQIAMQENDAVSVPIKTAKFRHMWQEFSGDLAIKEGMHDMFDNLIKDAYWSEAAPSIAQGDPFGNPHTRTTYVKHVCMEPERITNMQIVNCGVSGMFFSVAYLSGAKSL